MCCPNTWVGAQCHFGVAHPAQGEAELLSEQKPLLSFALCFHNTAKVVAH